MPWTVDDDGFLRTPSGMKAGRLTPDGELELPDKVEHRMVRIDLLALASMWREWMRRSNGWQQEP